MVFSHSTTAVCVAAGVLAAAADFSHLFTSSIRCKTTYLLIFFCKRMSGTRDNSVLIDFAKISIQLPSKDAVASNVKPVESFFLFFVVDLDVDEPDVAFVVLMAWYTYSPIASLICSRWLMSVTSFIYMRRLSSKLFSVVFAISGCSAAPVVDSSSGDMIFWRFDECKDTPLWGEDNKLIQQLTGGQYIFYLPVGIRWATCAFSAALVWHRNPNNFDFFQINMFFFDSVLWVRWFAKIYFFRSPFVFSCLCYWHWQMLRYLSWAPSRRQIRTVQ